MSYGTVSILLGCQINMCKNQADILVLICILPVSGVSQMSDVRGHSHMYGPWLLLPADGRRNVLNVGLAGHRDTRGDTEQEKVTAVAGGRFAVKIGFTQIT